MLGDFIFTQFLAVASAICCVLACRALVPSVCCALVALDLWVVTASSATMFRAVQPAVVVMASLPRYCLGCIF